MSGLPSAFRRDTSDDETTAISPTAQSTWNGTTAGNHFAPKTTSTQSLATRAAPSRVGRMTETIRTISRTNQRLTRNGSPWRRQKTGNATWLMFAVTFCTGRVIN